jgi:hypothetical protein
VSVTPEATGEQPIRAWRCAECGRISAIEWVAGRHVRLGASETDDWCHGAAEGPFYLLSQDEYLDVLLETGR